MNLRLITLTVAVCLIAVAILFCTLAALSPHPAEREACHRYAALALGAGLALAAFVMFGEVGQ